MNKKQNSNFFLFRIVCNLLHKQMISLMMNWCKVFKIIFRYHHVMFDQKRGKKKYERFSICCLGTIKGTWYWNYSNRKGQNVKKRRFCISVVWLGATMVQGSIFWNIIVWIYNKLQKKNIFNSTNSHWYSYTYM